MEDATVPGKLFAVPASLLPRTFDRVRVRLRAERCGVRSAMACADGVSGFFSLTTNVDRLRQPG